MNKTPNYQLNQWDKSDRIQMTDFNADNAKIEAALAQEAATRASADNSLQSTLSAELQTIRNLLPIVHLQTITTSAATNKLDIDLNGIDWNTYLYVLLRIDGTTSDSAAAFYVRMNNRSGESDYYSSSNGNSSNSQNYALSIYLPLSGIKRTTLLLVSGHGSYPEVRARRLGDTNFYSAFLSKTEALSTLSLVGRTTSYTINAGTTIQMYGIKL